MLRWSNIEDASPTPVSIVMAVHNAATALRQSLPPLLSLTVGRAELLILLDQTGDTSLDVIKHTCASTRMPVRVWDQPKPQWEAASENFLMRQSHATDWFISVQPDQIIQEPGWNAVLARPAQQYGDVFAVSARCGHDLNRPGHRGGSNYVGRCGTEIFKPLRHPPDMRSFHVRGTVNRGPLLMHANRTRELSYLDADAFPMDDSEHDLNCRAQQRGWVVGFYPIKVFAPNELGTKQNATQLRSASASMIAKQVYAKRQQLARDRRPSTCLFKTPSFRQPVEVRNITGTGTGTGTHRD